MLFIPQVSLRFCSRLLLDHQPDNTKDTYLRALYYRLAMRRGKNRAAVAFGRTILQIAYYVLRRGTTYEELGGDYFERRDQERVTHRLVKRLEDFGYEVSLTAAPSG